MNPFEFRYHPRTLERTVNSIKAGRFALPDQVKKRIQSNRRNYTLGDDGWVDENLFNKFREHMPLASVDILAVYEGKILLMLRNNEPGKNLWFVPGGRVRYGETLKQAAIRKLREETGLSAIKIEKKGVMCHFWPQAHYVSTFFVAGVADDRVELNDEHRDYRWISKVGDDIHHYVKDMIRETGIFRKNST